MQPAAGRGVNSFASRACSTAFANTDCPCRPRPSGRAVAEDVAVGPGTNSVSVSGLSSSGDAVGVEGSASGSIREPGPTHCSRRAWARADAAAAPPAPPSRRPLAMGTTGGGTIGAGAGAADATATIAGHDRVARDAVVLEDHPADAGAQGQEHGDPAQTPSRHRRAPARGCPSRRAWPAPPPREAVASSTPVADDASRTRAMHVAETPAASLPSGASAAANSATLAKRLSGVLLQASPHHGGELRRHLAVPRRERAADPRP